MFMHGASVQKNGRVMTDVLLVKVKKPLESEFPNDDYIVLKHLDEASLYRSSAESGCKLP